jgi:DUF971 family protein
MLYWGESATMPLAKSKTSPNSPDMSVAVKTPKIKGLNEVGRYAVGVKWADGHDSIFPLENLRRFCPCNECGSEADGGIPDNSQQMMQLSRLGDTGLYIAWADGHETLYTTAQLRDRCRCAYCAGEPEKPITGG